MRTLRGIQAIILVLFILPPFVSLSLAQQPSNPTADVRTLKQGEPFIRDIKAGEAHAYQITLAAGQLLRAVVEQRGIDVVVTVFAPDDTKITEVDSPNGTQGPEPVEVAAQAAGTYRLEVRPLEDTARPGRYEVRVEQLLTAEKYAQRLAAEKAKTGAVTKWLKANAIPLRSVEAESGLADMRPLKGVLKGVRIVGLGEAMHGSREFFRLKHRMLEFLVKEMGFRVFAIEASYPACFSINDYVMGRTDDGAKALHSQGFWTWDTNEVRDMLDWLRAYNQSAPLGEKVKFVGYDIQVNEQAEKVVLAYLRRVAPGRVGGTEALFRMDLVEATSKAFAGSGQEKAEALTKLADAHSRYLELLGHLSRRQIVL